MILMQTFKHSCFIIIIIIINLIIFLLQQPTFTISFFSNTWIVKTY